MRDFTCPNCGQRLAFENSVCLSCGSSAGIFARRHGAAGHRAGRRERARAVRSTRASTSCAPICIWPNATGWSRRGRCARLCTSCALTRTRPNDADTVAMAAFATAEKAKRRLIAELDDLKLPIVGRDEDPDFGLAFDLLSSRVREGVHRPRERRDHPGSRRGRRRAPRAAADLDGRAVPHPARPLPPRDRALLLLPAGRHVAGLPAAAPRTVRRSRGRLPGRAGPALQRGRAARLGERLRVVLRHHAPRRGLGRDVRALPAHPRHPGHRRGVRHRAGGRHASSEGCWGPADSTPSSRCGCRCRGR